MSFFVVLKHYQKDNALSEDKEKRAGTRSLHAINIHLIFRFVKRDSTKKVDFSEKDIFVSSNARRPRLRFSPRFRGGLTHVLLRAVAKQGTTSARFAWSGAGTKEKLPPSKRTEGAGF